MRLLKTLPVVLAGFLFIAGCTSPPAAPDAAPGSAKGVAGKGPGQAVAVSPANYQWKSTGKDGEVTALPGVNPKGFVSGADPFAVPAAKELWLNITLTGPVTSDAHVRYIPPGCDESSCLIETRTKGQKDAFQVEDPEKGEWGLVFFADPAVPFYGTYHLDINALLAEA